MGWISYVKISHKILGWFLGQRRDEYKIYLEEFFNFCKINVYGLAFFRCEFHDILSIISISLIVDAIGFKISKNELGHINELLKTKAIPTPKLLIKYHKRLKSMGEFPTRLVIPETNFLATFEKVGYLGLKIYWKRMR